MISGFTPKRAFFSLFVAGVLAAACGSDDSGGGSSPCTTNNTRTCSCDDGAQGAETCGEDGVWGPCACCGNGTIETDAEGMPIEECDLSNFNGETCSSLTMGASSMGSLSCDPMECKVLTTGCMSAPPPPSTGGSGGVGGTTGGGGTFGGGGTTGGGGTFGGGGTTF